MKKQAMPTIIGCMCVQLCMGVIYIWSAFKASAMSYYGWANGPVNMVTSFMMFSFCAGSFVGGMIQDRIGPRRVMLAGCVLFGSGVFAASLLPATSAIGLFYLSYCVLGGLGSGFVYGSAISCLQKWLPHRRGLAAGLAAAAFGLSTVVFSPLAAWMLGWSNMPTTLRAMAILFFIVGVVSCLFIRLPGQAYLDGLNVPASAATGRNMTMGQTLRTAPFWYLWAGMFLINGTWNMVNPLIKGLGMERGLTEALAVLALSLTGVTNAAGRLSMATVSDKLGRISTIRLLCAITTVAAVMLMFAGGPVYSLAVLICAFAYGGPAAVYPALISDLFGPKYSGSNYGVIMLALGCSSVVFNALSNYFYQVSGGYLLSFAVGAASALATVGVISMVEPAYRKTKEQ